MNKIQNQFLKTMSRLNSLHIFCILFICVAGDPQNTHNGMLVILCVMALTVHIVLRWDYQVRTGAAGEVFAAETVGE